MTEQERNTRIVEVARSWLDTPYRHHQSLRGYGADCVGFLAGVAREIGLEVEIANYHALPTGDGLIRQLDRLLVRADRPRNPGDILAARLAFNGIPRHILIATDIGVIHADERSGRVVETPIGYWERLIAGVWRWPT